VTFHFPPGGNMSTSISSLIFDRYSLSSWVALGQTTRSQVFATRHSSPASTPNISHFSHVTSCQVADVMDVNDVRSPASCVVMQCLVESIII